MPHFLDTFTQQVREKREVLREKIMTGRVSELDSDLKSLLLSHWHPITAKEASQNEVVAIDGSRAIRQFASGAILYITRALAIYGKRRFRKLETDCFLCRAKSTDIQVFVNTKMEWMEFGVAIKTIEEAGLSNATILIDGSLYGRLTHLPRDQPAEGMKDFMLDYFETFYKLLEICHKRNILILGVSKDSRSSFLRNYFLRLIFEDEIKNLNNISPAHRKKLLEIFEDVFEKPSDAFGEFRKLKRVYGELGKIEQILYEAIAARSDHQLIRSFAEERGYTTPIELSVSRRWMDRLRQIRSDPTGYVTRYFKESLFEKDPETLKGRAVNVLSKIPKFPTMISFHVLLDARDTPLRIDTPSWVYDMAHNISSFGGARTVSVDVRNILGLMLKGYGGLKDYNIWLKRVDEEVRLTNDTVDRIYSSALEKLLDLTVIHTRGYRRVKYP